MRAVHPSQINHTCISLAAPKLYQRKIHFHINILLHASFLVLKCDPRGTNPITGSSREFYKLKQKHTHIRYLSMANIWRPWTRTDLRISGLTLFSLGISNCFPYKTREETFSPLRALLSLATTQLCQSDLKGPWRTGKQMSVEALQQSFVYGPWHLTYTKYFSSLSLFNHLKM